jgi:hypothetical protein
MSDTTTKTPGRAVKRVATTVLGLLTLTVLGAALVASFPALLGAGSAIGVPEGAPVIGFALVPDVATGIGLLAGLVLRHDRAARRIAIASLTTFALSSGLANASAALGVTPHGLVPERVEGLPVWLSLCFALIPVVAIVLSADLAVRIVANLWPVIESQSVPPRRPATVVPAADSATRKTKVSAKVSESKGKRPPHRTQEELLDAARALASEWARDGRSISASGFVKALRVSHTRAAGLRDTLRGEGFA